MPSQTQKNPQKSAAAMRKTRFARAALTLLMVFGAAVVEPALASRDHLVIANDAPAAARIVRKAERESSRDIAHHSLSAATPATNRPLIPELMMTAIAALAVIRRLRIELRRAPEIFAVA